MHFHVPKPLHGWREFAGEVGIIVLGVLIALGAEQMIEGIRAHQRSERARLALHSELEDDDLPQAYARLAIAKCLTNQLTSLENALDAHLDRAKYLEMAKSYHPPARTWDDQAWTAVVATGDLSHGGADELIRWSQPYRLIPSIRVANQSEALELMNLRSISPMPGPMTSIEQDRETVALAHLQSWSRFLFAASRFLIEGAHEAGIDLSQRQRQQVIEELRPGWGGCVSVPHLATVNLNTQGPQPVGRF